MKVMNRKSMVAGIGFSILTMSLFFASDFYGTNTFTGRMTGGGSIFLDAENDLIDGFAAPGGTRITHGFQLHCGGANNDPQNIVPPNNLQINVHLPDGQDHRFHLEELTNAECMRDPDISPAPPKSSENYWYDGAGTGRYDGVGGYCADWIFTDEGEPGTDDRIVSLRIWSDCQNGSGFVVSIGDAGPEGHDPLGGRTLTFGNHQAHQATGKK